MTEAAADAHRTWPWPASPFDFFETTRLLRTGCNDPTVRRQPDGLWRTTQTDAGPATVRLLARPGQEIEALAWGEGAAQAVDRVPAWLGIDRDPPTVPSHPAVDRIRREHAGVRLNDTGDAFEALVNITLQQLVTWNEAAFNWRRLVETFGTTAPGPMPLRLPPTAQSLRRADPDRIAALGIHRQQANTLREIAFAATALQRALRLPTGEAASLLQQVRGVGPWTSAMALGMRLGRPEPLVSGDLHLPHTVSWALAGEPRGSQARMAELLAPFDGVAFYIVRLLYAARIEAPRRRPKRELRFGRV
ncbi:MAG: hypothetical protein KDI88_03610 [Gammaproteobacteria bacterium]|nr:hypothetical protein [Gammaproteobacteria bacterium]